MRDIVNVVRALSADTRLRVLKLLQNGPLSAGDLQESLGLPRQTVAYHLQVLRRGGLVASRRESGRTLYAASLPSVADESGRFERFLTHALQDVR
jgi:DNA-binding transcriptional ArsR family regulator